MPVDAAKIDRLTEWLIDGARSSPDIRATIAEVCGRLRQAGVPVSRFVLLFLQLHPNLLGSRFCWLEDGSIEQTDARFGLFDDADFRDNPMSVLLETRQPIRRKLCDPDCPADFQLLQRLKAEGVTDYLVAPMLFSDGEAHGMTWATTREGGFEKADLAALERIRGPFTRVFESYILRLTASNLLSAYVGHDIGHKILAGKVRRGDVEEITACVVFADLVGFTRLSNERPATEVLKRLNTFYDCVVPPILERGGEVLKFMGDGILAIFPIKPEEPDAEVTACRLALAALRQAWGGGDGPVFSEDRPPFRAAVHVGKVQYGNIGALNRLDFTAIGPAVNLTARFLEAAKAVEGQTVVSEPVARLLQLDPALAEHVSIRDFEGKQPVYTVARMAAD